MVRFPIRGVYPGKTQIPDGPWVQAPESIDFSQRKELTADYLDKCYIVSSGISTVEWTGSKVKMTIEADDIFRHLIVYCPEDEHDFFAVEPVTNCNNAFNMAERGIRDTGTLLIMPGQEISGEIRIKIER